MASKQAMGFGDGLATASSSLPSAMAGGEWGNGVWAREGARGSFYRRQGEGGRTGSEFAGEGSPGGGAHGRGSSAGRRRGERTDGGCAWRAQMVPRGGGFGKTRGARGGLGLGLGTCPSRWPAPAYGVASGRGAGRREVEEPASGNLVNKPKFQNSVL